LFAYYQYIINREGVRSLGLRIRTFTFCHSSGSDPQTLLWIDVTGCENVRERYANDWWTQNSL